MPSSNSPRPDQTVTYPSPVTDTDTVTDPLPVPIRPLRILACPGRGCCSSLPCPALPCAPTQLTPKAPATTTFHREEPLVDYAARPAVLASILDSQLPRHLA